MHRDILHGVKLTDLSDLIFPLMYSAHYYVMLDGITTEIDRTFLLLLISYFWERYPTCAAINYDKLAWFFIILVFAGQVIDNHNADFFITVLLTLIT